MTARPPNRLRSKQSILWFTPEEHTTLTAAARKAGLGLGPWLRMLGLAEADVYAERDRKAARKERSK